MQSLPRYLAILLLVCGLILPPVVAYIAVYATMALMLIGMVLPNGAAAFRALRWPYAAVGGAYLLVLASLPFVYRGPPDLMAPLALLPVLFMPGVPGLLRRLEPGFSITSLASVCLAGAALGVGAGLVEMLVMQSLRIGVWNNPIHFASITMLLGFTALIGVPGNASPWRLVFLCGPLLGLAAAILSGSRGPMFAAGLMGAVSLPLLFIWSPQDRRRLALLAALAIGGIAALSLFGLSRSASVIEAIGSILENGLAGAGDVIRSAMYETAIKAFGQSPLFGHGLGQMMQAAMAVATPEQQDLMAGYENLHSDIANFAVFAGTLGLLAYGLLIAAPLTLLRRSSRAIRLGAIILSSGFFALGLTNAMFGVLPQTVLYAVIFGSLCMLAWSGRNTV
ncbi:O-antigen ligase family protein [Devosia sp.]|uniref:O-antigen ligase family protein n=1 Tax=Devosia sp. TaxID=1871048 RepID=UPI002AFE9CDC|nr:O-antigen ligase family protein [Devosia sp.]